LDVLLLSVSGWFVRTHHPEIRTGSNHSGQKRRGIDKLREVAEEEYKNMLKAKRMKLSQKSLPSADKKRGDGVAVIASMVWLV